MRYYKDRKKFNKILNDDMSVDELLRQIKLSNFRKVIMPWRLSFEWRLQRKIYKMINVNMYCSKGNHYSKSYGLKVMVNKKYIFVTEICNDCVKQLRYIPAIKLAKNPDLFTIKRHYMDNVETYLSLAISKGKEWIMCKEEDKDLFIQRRIE